MRFEFDLEKGDYEKMRALCQVFVKMDKILMDEDEAKVDFEFEGSPHFLIADGVRVFGEGEAYYSAVITIQEWP